MKSITYTIEIKWIIIGYDNYGFGSDKILYNLKTNRRLKQSYNSGSIGYWFGKRFIPLSKLRNLLKKPTIEFCPF
jgi:hypothetical protein